MGLVVSANAAAELASIGLGEGFCSQKRPLVFFWLHEYFNFGTLHFCLKS